MHDQDHHVAYTYGIRCMREKKCRTSDEMGCISVGKLGCVCGGDSVRDPRFLSDGDLFGGAEDEDAEDFVGGANSRRTTSWVHAASFSSFPDVSSYTRGEGGNIPRYVAQIKALELGRGALMRGDDGVARFARGGSRAWRGRMNAAAWGVPRPTRTPRVPRAASSDWSAAGVGTSAGGAGGAERGTRRTLFQAQAGAPGAADGGGGPPPSATDGSGATAAAGAGAAAVSAAATGAAAAGAAAEDPVPAPPDPLDTTFQPTRMAHNWITEKKGVDPNGEMGVFQLDQICAENNRFSSVEIKQLPAPKALARCNELCLSNPACMYAELSPVGRSRVQPVRGGGDAAVAGGAATAAGGGGGADAVAGTGAAAGVPVADATGAGGAAPPTTSALQTSFPEVSPVTFDGGASPDADEGTGDSAGGAPAQGAAGGGGAGETGAAAAAGGGAAAPAAAATTAPTAPADANQAALIEARRNVQAHHAGGVKKVRAPSDTMTEEEEQAEAARKKREAEEEAKKHAQLVAEAKAILGQAGGTARTGCSRLM